jgi:hypothetical protein
LLPTYNETLLNATDLSGESLLNCSYISSSQVVCFVPLVVFLNVTYRLCAYLHVDLVHDE